MAINDQISARIQVFTAELEMLVRASALEAVRQALGGAAAGRANGGRANGGRANGGRANGGRVASRQLSPKATVASAPKARGRGRKGGKRPPGQLAALVTRTGEWIKANPGHGVEDMARAMNVRTKELALPIQKLLADKTIKKRGEKRATKYSGA